MSDTYAYRFKGDTLANLCRIDGTLTTISPLHIGTGETRDDLVSWEKMKEKKEAGTDTEPPQIAEIERDAQGLPLITGSALRGVVRHYLLAMFRGLRNGKIAREVEYESATLKQMNQAQQKDYMREASLLEQLFGTPFCESKIEVWDGFLGSTIDGHNLKVKGWENSMQSYVVRSVAIDPETGAAARNKLYSFDVAPAGLTFNASIVGRNISPRELGLLLIGLEGFNNPIFPLTLGAMSGRGFGRMSWSCHRIYQLQRDDLPKWVDAAGSNEEAGFALLAKLEIGELQQNQFIDEFKLAFQLGTESRT